MIEKFARIYFSTVESILVFIGMSKRRKLEVVDTAQWRDNTVLPVDWNLCILCQNNSTETLICPTTTGYVSLINNLTKFAEHNALPPTVRLERLDDGSGILCTFVKNNAKYHKMCRNRYDEQKISRLSASMLDATDVGVAACSSVSTRSSAVTANVRTSCIFCDGESVPVDKLVSAFTKDIGPKIHAQAVEMQDTKLLSKLASTDFIALEVKYHKACYIRFRNSWRSHQRAITSSNSDPYRLTYGSVMTELVQYMEEMYLYSDTAPVFRLADLTKLVANRMTSLGIQLEERSVNRTRLKEQLLSLIPGLREVKIGREVILTFEPDVADAIHEACEYNDMTDGMCIARAASILRRDMFTEFPKFSGTLTEGFSSRDCVPPSLLNFITTLLGGYNIDNGSPASFSEQTAASSIAQLIRFNSVKRRRVNRPEHTRHHVSHETPLPVYLGLMIHSCTRKKSVVDKMNGLGLCISYDRVQEIEATVTNVLCDNYRSFGDVIPSTLSKGVFTTAAIDNIDHNTSSSTAVDSFHGSSVSIIQHPDNQISRTNMDLFDSSSTRRISSTLPDTFTEIPATGNVACNIPLSTVNTAPVATHIKALEQLSSWLNVVENAVCSTRQADNVSNTAFAAYHSKANVQPDVHVCHNVMLPLLPAHIQSPATVRHLMNIVTRIVSTVNSSQPAVITADQPVYAIAKYVQWTYPELYGEDKIVMMMGGLHIEMAIDNMLGKWLAGSGWSDMFLKAEIATAGRCDSLLKCSHVKRTRYAHEVSLASLFILRDEAFNADSNGTESLEAWVSRRCKESVQFLYWQTTMELESLLLTFVRSIRESNFTLYMQMLKDVCPWFFALDQTHYSRWLPVFIKTLEELPVRHPQVYESFQEGHFTSKKTDASFSAISDDHLHEQNNKLVKGDGGAVDILANDTALLKWMVAGPEIARIVRDFEVTDDVAQRDKTNPQWHHEDTLRFQSRFVRHVSEVVKSVRSDGNPFAEQELQTADNRKIVMTESAEKSVAEARVKGQEQYQQFVQDRLVFGRKSVSEPLPKTNLKLFHETVRQSNKSLSLIHI